MSSNAFYRYIIVLRLLYQVRFPGFRECTRNKYEPGNTNLYSLVFHYQDDERTKDNKTRATTANSAQERLFTQVINIF